MPSPFPGMDPYLEGEMWQEFHSTFANAIRAQLLPRLKPKYVALLAKRYAFRYFDFGVAASEQGKTIYSDVGIVKEARTAYATATRETGIADITPPTAEVTLPDAEPFQYLAIEIRDTAERRLVTAIEILSPENKTARGIEDYLAKRAAILRTDTHLLEIDLLRRGLRLPTVGKLPPAAYYVFLSRSTHAKTQLWAIQLRDQLPVVPVPLLAPDADAPLDLQAALTACFDLVGYETLLDYSKPLADLSAEDAAWVEERGEKNQCH